MTDWTLQSRGRDRTHAPVIAAWCSLSAFPRSPSTFLPFPSPDVSHIRSLPLPRPSSLSFSLLPVSHYLRYASPSRTFRLPLRWFCDARNCFPKRRRRGPLIRGFARTNYREICRIRSLTLIFSYRSTSCPFMIVRRSFACQMTCMCIWIIGKNFKCAQL